MRAISWMAFLPNCGVAPCAALPRVSSSSHKLPLCAVTTRNFVGSPTMAESRAGVSPARAGEAGAKFFPARAVALAGQAGRLSYECARTGLRVFLVNQSGEERFPFPADAIWRSASSQSAESMAATEPFVSHAPRP